MSPGGADLLIDLIKQLNAFARQSIAADDYPADEHRFSMFECDTCGLMPFDLTIERHAGAQPSDFMGVIRGRCMHCSQEKVLLSITSEEPQVESSETPTCLCGGQHFLAGLCERFEGAEGLPGFFDEGVAVGLCIRCGRIQALVYTD